MISSNDIALLPIDEKKFYEIKCLLNNDDKVNKFVSFYDSKSTNGIILNGELIGLFTLNKFINDNLAIHIALLKKFRNKGIGGTTLNKIVIEYGKNYPESQFFLANIKYENQNAIHLLEKLGWSKTYAFDETMDNEGGEFFIIYQKENPNYNLNYLNRKVMKYDTK